MQGHLDGDARHPSPKSGAPPCVALDAGDIFEAYGKLRGERANFE